MKLIGKIVAHAKVDDQHANFMITEDKILTINLESGATISEVKLPSSYRNWIMVRNSNEHVAYRVGADLSLHLVRTDGSIDLRVPDTNSLMSRPQELIVDRSSFIGEAGCRGSMLARMEATQKDVER